MNESQINLDLYHKMRDEQDEYRHWLLAQTPKEILNSSGYLRSFPGIAKRSDVNGVSRGVEYNMAQSAVYRVCGGKLY